MKKSSLRITILDFDDIKNPLLGAGQALATKKIGTRLVKMGYHIEVICSKYPGYENRIEDDIKYTHIGIATKNIRFNNLIYILSLPFYVQKLRSNIIVECFTAPISTLFIPLFTKIPVVGLTTSFEAEYFSKKYHLPFKSIEKFGLKFYKYIIASSEYYLAKIRKINPKTRIKVIYQGVDEEYFQVKQKKSRYLLFLGRFDISQKGIDFLLQAYSQIASKIKYPLYLAGCGPDEEKVKELVKKYKLSKKVHFLGPTYGKDKLKVLSKALVFVLPSRHEGFCIAALEALASGIPVVSFDIPGLSWLSNDVVLKAKPFQMNEFAKNISLACDEKVNTQLRKNCKKIAKKFSWDNTASKYQEFFQFVIRDAKNN